MKKEIPIHILFEIAAVWVCAYAQCTHTHTMNEKNFFLNGEKNNGNRIWIDSKIQSHCEQAWKVLKSLNFHFLSILSIGCFGFCFTVCSTVYICKISLLNWVVAQFTFKWKSPGGILCAVSFSSANRMKIEPLTSTYNNHASTISDTYAFSHQ